MGVKTKAWGPHAWVFYHGLCQALDQYVAAWGVKASQQVIALAIETIGKAYLRAPCIYCRRSMKTFLSTPATDLNLLYHPNGPKSFAQWAYRMHECVNRKLFWQQVKTDPASIWTYWLGYQPLFAEVHYTQPAEPLWWHSLFTFAYYSVCDYDDERSAALTTFLPETAHLLREMGYHTGEQLHHALQQVQRPADFGSNRGSRIDYIQHVQRAMHLQGGVSVPRSVWIDQVCQHAIVGCNPLDTTKVGCT